MKEEIFQKEDLKCDSQEQTKSKDYEYLIHKLRNIKLRISLLKNNFLRK